ncbi:MAG: hypothetical protein FGM61_05970 [Sediminibacterium sp.]|nr:hypothetical protein [Sediminibacterium sp.]
MVTIKFEKIRSNAKIPTRSTELSGGWDVVCTTVICTDDDAYICALGFALQPPPNYRVVLVPRSSLTKTRWVMQNSPGIGDADYTGEYAFRFRAIPMYDAERGFIYPEFPFSVGDRIGQIYLEEIIPIEFKEVDALTETVRGDGGFGSTGK